jgi:hypothetical protein
VIPNGAIGARLSPDGGTLYVTDVTGLGIYDVTDRSSPQVRAHLPLPWLAAVGRLLLVDVSDPKRPAVRAVRAADAGMTVYDVRDLSRPAERWARRGEELAWVTDEHGTFAFDLTDPSLPRLVLGGPGEPRCEHRRLLSVLTRRARLSAWPGRGAPVGFYASAGSFWGAYLAPTDCPSLTGRLTERSTLSPIGERDRAVSWGRGPVPSPFSLAERDELAHDCRGRGRRKLDQPAGRRDAPDPAVALEHLEVAAPAARLEAHGPVADAGLESSL